MTCFNSCVSHSVFCLFPVHSEDHVSSFLPKEVYETATPTHVPSAFSGIFIFYFLIVGHPDGCEVVYILLISIHDHMTCTTLHCLLLNVTLYLKLFLCSLNSDRQKSYFVFFQSFPLCEIVHIDLSTSLILFFPKHLEHSIHLNIHRVHTTHQGSPGLWPYALNSLISPLFG